MFIAGLPLTSPYTGDLSGLAYEGGHFYAASKIGPGQNIVEIDPATSYVQSVQPIYQTMFIAGLPLTSPYTGDLSGLVYENGHFDSTSKIGPGQNLVEIDLATSYIKSLDPIYQTMFVAGLPLTSPYTGNLSGIAYDKGELYSTTTIGGREDLIEIDPTFDAVLSLQSIYETIPIGGLPFAFPYKGIISGLAFDDDSPGGLTTVPLPSSMGLFSICLFVLGSRPALRVRARISGSVG